MNKKLQDHVWKHCLPKEFKEEVKRMWSVEVDCATKYKSELHKHRTELLYELFGEHLHWQNNLTSNAEGEDNLQEKLWNMLTPELQTYCLNMGRTSHDGNVEDVLAHLFGSKCLPDK